MDALTPSTAGRAGLSRIGLYRGARAGQFDRIARGIYLPAEASAADWDQLEAATGAPMPPSASPQHSPITTSPTRSPPRWT